MRLVENIRAGYSFLEGIAPYSSGVIAADGYEIIHITLAVSLPWEEGMHAARKYVESMGLSQWSLCGFELRCPQPHTMNGFIDFNTNYRALLQDWDMYVDGENPIARTNVAPVLNPPNETMLYGFSVCQESRSSWNTFVIAGGGELVGGLQKGVIVCEGETDEAAMLEKAQTVARLMKTRLDGLGANGRRLSTIDVYTAHSLYPLIEGALAAEIGAITRRGLQWFYARPPIIEIEFEMDMRGVQQERIVDIGH
jgi:hypothetical protein